MSSPACGPDDVDAEHPVGLGVGEDFHETIGGLIGLGAAIGEEQKLAGLVLDGPRP